MSEHPIGHQDTGNGFGGREGGFGPGNCLLPRHILPSRPLDHSLRTSLHPEYASGLDLDLDTQPGPRKGAVPRPLRSILRAGRQRQLRNEVRICHWRAHARAMEALNKESLPVLRRRAFFFDLCIARSQIDKAKDG
jgi:hypothetical protein